MYTSLELLLTCEIHSVDIHNNEYMKRRGRIRYQIDLSPLFQSHQAQLYIERKRLLM